MPDQDQRNAHGIPGDAERSAGRGLKDLADEERVPSSRQNVGEDHPVRIFPDKNTVVSRLLRQRK